MSGGHFNYVQYHLESIAEKLETLVKENVTEEGLGDDNGFPYSDDTIQKFKEAIHVLRLGYEMVDCIDWFVSGDTYENTFKAEWKEKVEGCK